MNEQRYAFIHLSGVALIVILGTICLQILDTSVTVNTGIENIYLFFLPISLLCQTAMMLGNKKFSHQIRALPVWDFFSVILFYLAAIGSILLSPPNSLKHITAGLLIGFTLIRAGILLKFLVLTLCRHPQKQLLLVFLSAVLLLLPLAAWRIATQPLDGDEPFYLLLTHSILHDHDINLENNYLNKDSLSFLDRELSPQQFDTYVNGRLISRHPPLMGLILLPGFLVGKLTGAVLIMVLLAGVLSGAIFWLLTTSGIGVPTAALLSIFVVLTGPVRFYAMSIFTELPAAIVGLIAVGAGFKIYQRQKTNWALLIIALVLVISLKLRFSVLCLPPVFLGLLFRSNKLRNIWRTILIIATGLTLIGIANTIIYGSPFVRYSLHDLTGLTGIRLYRGFFGILLDQQYGIIPLNPLFALCFFGVCIYLRRHRLNRFLIWSSGLVCSIFLVAAFSELTGGICPRGRFLTAWLPLLVIPLAFAMEWLEERGYSSIYYMLMSLTIIISSVHIIEPSWQIVMPGSVDKIPAFLSQALNSDVLQIIPSFDRVYDSLIYHGLALFSVLMIFSLALLCLRSKNRHVTYMKVSVSVMAVTGLMLLMGFTGWSFQSEWMEFEDPSFQRAGNESLFWEETRSWEYSTPSSSPYRSGSRLFPGGTITRELPLRNPADANTMHFALEIVARGAIPKTELPSFTIFAGDEKLAEFRLRSTQMESYFCPWPYGTLDIAPKIRIENTGQSTNATSVDLDRMRLVSWNQPWPIQIRDTDSVLPLSIGPVTVNSVHIETPEILLGSEIKVQLNYDVTDSIEGYKFGVLLKSHTRTSIHNLVIDPSNQGIDQTFTFTPSMTIGNGTFHLLLWGQEPNSGQSLIEPSGIHCFKAGQRAWIGSIEITPAPTLVDPIWTEKLTHLYEQSPDQTVILLPNAFHIAENTTISIPVNLSLTPEQSIEALSIVSHISGVFQEIPFETMIGEISLLTRENTHRIPVKIGKHTAEAMYRITGSNLMISHTCPEPFHTIEETVAWPPIMEGIEYDALYFKADFPVHTQEEPIELAIRTGAFPGTWNIYAIAFVTK